ncbi:N-acetylmuramoyl-L-alanine amidase, partial [Patescibacteria group bacterium]|nr:N-acetylmuramoyl-L-alanine amidase [Patescibacteria group bacterium]
MTKTNIPPHSPFDNSASPKSVSQAQAMPIPKVTLLLKAVIILTFLCIGISLSVSVKKPAAPIYRTGTISIDNSFQNNSLKTASGSAIPNKYEKENIYESKQIKPDFAFNGLILSWAQYSPPKTDAKIYLKFKNNDQWEQDWQLAEIDDESLNSSQSKEFIADSLVLTDNADSFMYKIVTVTDDNNQSPKITGLNFEYIQASDIISTSVKSETLYASLVIPGGEKTLIKRSTWGANEALTYQEDEEESNGRDLSDIEKSTELTSDTKDSKHESIPQTVKINKIIDVDPVNEKKYKWPLQYPEKINKIIIHHTATTRDIKRPLVAIRNIYYYHTMRKGWGDIGYNYLIDPYGNIYEGRRGGDSVVGGHAYGFNTGTIGIALLGNYENDQPSYEMVNSLVNLLDDLSRKHNISPTGVSEFNGKIIPNISGHFQVQATKCPGKNIKEILPDIRKLTAHTGQSASLSISGEPSAEEFDFEESGDYSPVRMSPDQMATFEIKLKNTGRKNWDQETFLVANQNGLNQGRIEFPDKYVISKQQESLVKPGEIGTFKMNLKSGLRPGFIVFDVTLIYNGDFKTDKYLSLPVFIDKPNTGYSVNKSYINEEKFNPGDTIEGYFEIENLSGFNWTNTGQNEVKIIFDGPLWRQSDILPKGRLILGTLQQDTVTPGEIGRFNFTATAPNYGGIYEEKLALYNDTLGRLEGQPIELNLTVGTPKPAASFVTMSSDTQFKAGETKLVTFQLKNIGTTEWRRIGQDAFNVVTIKNPAIKVPDEITFKESEVKPGQIGHFEFYVTAPQTSENYSIIFVPWHRYMRMIQDPVVFRFTVGESGGSSNGSANSDTSSKNTQIENPIRIKITSTETGTNNRYSLPAPIITASSNFKVIAGGKILNNFNLGQNLEITYRENKYFITGDKIALVTDQPVRIVPENNGKIEVVNMQ